VLAALNRLGTLDSADQLRKLYSAASPLFTSPASPESTVRRVLDAVWGVWLGGTLGVSQPSQGTPLVLLARVLLRASCLYDCCRPVADRGTFFRGMEVLLFAKSTGLFQTDGRPKLVDQYLEIFPDQDGTHMLQEQDAVFRFQARGSHDFM
jgi:hypothetical protein